MALVNHRGTGRDGMEQLCSLCGKRPQDENCPVEMCGSSIEDSLGQENVCTQCYAEVVKAMGRTNRVTEEDR